MQIKPDTSAEARYPIRYLSEQTGVLPVTLRAWERRYGLLKPARTPAGHRLYSEADVRRVRQILQLIEQGIPVGKVRDVLRSASISNANVDASATSVSDWPDWRRHLLAACRELDTAAVVRQLRQAGQIYPVGLLARELILPAYRMLRVQDEPGRWAFVQTLDQAVTRLIEMRLQSLEAARVRPQILLCSAWDEPEVTPAGLLPARLFEIEALEAGHAVHFIGKAPGPMAFAELLQAHQALGGIVWCDQDVVDDRITSCRHLKQAAPVPIRIAGDWAIRQRKHLETAFIPWLPEDHADAMKILAAWK